MRPFQREISLGFDPRPFVEGVHVCLLYAEEDERRDILAQYVASGIRDGDDVCYFADVETTAELDDAAAMLGAGSGAVSRGPGRLHVRRAVDTYCPDGSFSPERMLDTLAEAHRAARSSGLAGARVAGEMTWSRRGLPGSDQLVQYEARINRLVRAVPTTAVCQYDTRRFDGKTLYDILRVHPMMIVRGHVVENPYYIDHQGVSGPPVPRHA